VTSDDGDPVSVVHAFNDAINRRDLAAVVGLMTPTHRFVDAEGGSVAGRAACEEAWRGFFESFPDYRNIFASVDHVGDGTVVVAGRSECADPRLDGAASWWAVVRDGLVDVWQVGDAGAALQ